MGVIHRIIFESARLAIFLTRPVECDRMKSTIFTDCAHQEEKMFRPEPLDLLLIAIVAMLIFGANRLPEIARGIGGALREFRKGLAEKSEEKPKS